MSRDKIDRRAVLTGLVAMLLVGCGGEGQSRLEELAFPAVDQDGDGYRVLEDCDDARADHYRLLPFGAADRDGDGYRSHETGEACSGVELAEGFFEAPDGFADCDDMDVTRWRFATTYVDGDGDGVGSGPGTVTCIGVDADAGQSLYGYDPLDDPSDPDSLAVSDFDLPIYLLTTN